MFARCVMVNQRIVQLILCVHLVSYVVKILLCLVMFLNIVTVCLQCVQSIWLPAKVRRAATLHSPIVVLAVNAMAHLLCVLMVVHCLMELLATITMHAQDEKRVCRVCAAAVRLCAVAVQTKIARLPAPMVVDRRRNATFPIVIALIKRRLWADRALSTLKYQLATLLNVRDTMVLLTMPTSVFVMVAVFALLANVRVIWRYWNVLVTALVVMVLVNAHKVGQMKRVVQKWTTKARSLTGIRTTTTPMLSTNVRTTRINSRQASVAVTLAMKITTALKTV
mmetsp:Transcript_6475/g.11250  ORF Transcript_6475/g.11250 Transcript_6475/m.11250 type:complete len:280 (+) Transcript_6475:4302-5141(+)